MAGLDDPTFVPITSAEHATFVVLAMRSRNRRLGSAADSPTLVIQTEQHCEYQPVGPTAETQHDGNLFVLHQFNDVVRQELQVLKARQAEEQRAKGYWEDSAVVRNDEAAPVLRLPRHRCNHHHPSSYGNYGGDGFKRDVSTKPFLLPAAPLPTDNSRTNDIDSALWNGVALADPQRPVNARETPTACQRKNTPGDDKACSNLRQSEDDEMRQDTENDRDNEEEEEDGKKPAQEEHGAAERADASISLQEGYFSNPVAAADDIDDAMPLCSTPVSPRTTLLCKPDPAVDVVLARKKGTQKKDVNSTVNNAKEELNDDACDGRDSTKNNNFTTSNTNKATKYRATIMGSVDRRAAIIKNSDDESWSSSEGDRGDMFGSSINSSSRRRFTSCGASRVDADDWAGTDPYGSDDEGFVVKGGWRTLSSVAKNITTSSVIFRTKSTNNKAVVAGVAGRQMTQQPEAKPTKNKNRELLLRRKLKVEGSDGRLVLGKQQTRFLSPPLVKKVGRNDSNSSSSSSSTRNGSNANNTTNTSNGGNSNTHNGGRTVETRTVSEKTAKKPLPYYPVLPHIRTGGAYSPSAPAQTNKARLTYSTEEEIGVGLVAEGASSGGKMCAGGGGDRDGAVETPWLCAKNRENAHQDRRSSSSGKLRDEEEGAKGDDDDDWVVREFQARVEAARLEAA